MSRPEESSLPNRAWLIVGLLWVAGFLNYIDRVMITTMRESLVAAVPMSDAEFGLLTSVFLWVYAVLSPLAGFVADRFSRSRIVVLSVLAWSVVTWLTAYASSFGELIMARAILGATQACYIPASLALIADYHRGATRSFATGVHISGVMIGAGLGGLGGWMAERLGWGSAFMVFGIIGVGYAIVMAAMLRDAPLVSAGAETGSVLPKPPLGLRDALTSLLSNPAFLVAFVFWGLIGIAGWAVIGWMPTFLNEQFNLSQGVAGLSATGYFQASALVGVLVGGAWADRWSRSQLRGRIYVPVIGLLLAAPGILLASHMMLLPLALTGLVIFGFGRAFTDSNMMPILCLVVDPRYRATGYGVLNFISCVIGGLTIYAGGVLRDSNFNVSRIFEFAAVSLVVCAALLLCIRPRPAQQDA